MLALTYTANIVDKQIIGVLAQDIKRDLHVSDADLGFLYGTAFAVFYAVFGIVMGQLADRVRRTRLLSVGLALWSAMTLLSGLSRSGAQLAAARVGVGIGEATSAPCAYSLISDYFPARRRATAIALYGGGLSIGAGLSLFLGGVIVERWSAAFPHGGPFGLVGWQAAFAAVALPGLALSLWVRSLREPVRGRYDPAGPSASVPAPPSMLASLAVLPPLGLVEAARGGRGPLSAHLLSAGLIAAVTAGLVRLTGDLLQWCAVGFGAYAVLGWAAALRRRDPPAFRAIWGNPPFLAVVLGYACVAAVSYSYAFWSVPYAVRTFHPPLSQAGLAIGLLSAAGGFVGGVVGGRLADRLHGRAPGGRLYVALVAAGLPILLLALSFSTRSLIGFYALQLPTSGLIAATLAPCSATAQELVPPHMRGVATATFYTGFTLIGLALGPYLVGHVSAATGSLALGIASVTPALVASMGFIAAAIRLMQTRDGRVGRPPSTTTKAGAATWRGPR